MLVIKTQKKINWDVCVFCQQSKNEELVQPHKNSQYHRSYDTIQTFLFIEEEGPLPFNMTKECLVEAGADLLAKSLLTMKAVFHKSCHDLFQKRK